MSSRLLTAGIAALAAGALLAGCTPPNENPTDQKVDTGASFTGTYPSESEASSSTSTTSATETTTTTTVTEEVDAENELDIQLSSSTLRDGENLNVAVTGLNPELGYYAAICAAAGSEVNPTPYCTGTEYDVDAQAWLRNDGGTTPINADGTANFSITPRAIGDSVNCYEEECVFIIFGDEYNSVGAVEETAVPVQFVA